MSLNELKAHPDCWSSAFQSTLKVAYRRTMYDREIVAAIVEGDSAALAAAFDQYAQGLYDYCRSLLAEPPEAAEAVQDTFIVAPARLSELRNPERLRAWLFAVARNECHSRLRVGLSPPSARPRTVGWPVVAPGCNSLRCFPALRPVALCKSAGDRRICLPMRW